jgi:hypothetical protein
MHGPHVSYGGCPQCGGHLCLHPPNGRLPKVDDATVCGHCGALLAFTAARSLRTMTHDEVRALDPGLREFLLKRQGDVMLHLVPQGVA